jgi:hypothetical protein
MGVKPLVIIGTLDYILDQLAENKDRGISNVIPRLPNIYFSITNYTPNKRFTGVFPYGDAVAQLAIDYLPLDVLAGVATGHVGGVVTNIILLYNNMVKQKIAKQ